MNYQWWFAIFDWCWRYFDPVIRSQPLWPLHWKRSPFFAAGDVEVEGGQWGTINDKWLKDFICAMVKTCCVSYFFLIFFGFGHTQIDSRFSDACIDFHWYLGVFLMHNHTVAQINTQKVYRRTDRIASYMEEVAKSTCRNAHHGTFGWFHQAFDPYLQNWQGRCDVRYLILLSGNLTVCYWKWHLEIVDLPIKVIKDGDFPVRKL